MPDGRAFPTFAAQLATACAVCSFVQIMGMSSGGELGLYPLILIPYAAAAYGIDRLFLRRERSMRALALLNTAMGVAIFAACFALGACGDIASALFTALFCLGLTVRAASLCLRRMELRSMLLTMELCLFLLVAQVGFGAASGMGVAAYAPIMAGAAASILGLVIYRTEGSLGARGWAFTAAAFAGIFALLWLLVSFAAAPAGQGIVAIWNAAVAAVKSVFSLIYRFLAFLVSLLPEAEYGEAEMETPEGIVMEELPETETSPVIAGILLAIIAALLIYGLVRLLIRLGRINIGGRKISAHSRAKRRRAALGPALARLFASWKKALRLRVRLWQRRSTPEGLLCILIRKCRLTPWHKRPGETPRLFLTRLADSAEDDAELHSALLRLIPAVDAAVYAPGGRGVDFDSAAAVRRRISSAVRRRFARDSLASAFAKIRHK